MAEIYKLTNDEAQQRADEVFGKGSFVGIYEEVLKELNNRITAKGGNKITQFHDFAHKLSDRWSNKYSKYVGSENICLSKRDDPEENGLYLFVIPAQDKKPEHQRCIDYMTDAEAFNLAKDRFRQEIICVGNMRQILEKLDSMRLPNRITIERLDYCFCLERRDMDNEPFYVLFHDY